MSVTTIDPTVPLEAQSPAPRAEQVALNERQESSPGGKTSPPQVEPIDYQALAEEAAAAISELMRQQDVSLQFQVDDVTGSSIVTVMDGESGDIIRQFPSEESVAIARYIAEFAELPRTGLLIDKVE